MTEKLTPFDAAEYLETSEDISVFLNEALASILREPIFGRPRGGGN